MIDVERNCQTNCSLCTMVLKVCYEFSIAITRCIPTDAMKLMVGLLPLLLQNKPAALLSALRLKMRVIWIETSNVTEHSKIFIYRSDVEHRLATLERIITIYYFLATFKYCPAHTETIDRELQEIISAIIPPKMEIMGYTDRYFLTFLNRVLNSDYKKYMGIYSTFMEYLKESRQYISALRYLKITIKTFIILIIHI